ncbi:MAG: AbrB/MazE/SpoVT family DNA-binding domain-containing protein [Caulobacterales bacterium]
MEFVTLRRAGGSLTLTIPRALVRALGLAAGARLGVSVDDGKLVAAPAAPDQPRYTLEELLAQCDPDAPLSAEDDAWLSDGPVGAELI